MIVLGAFALILLTIPLWQGPLRPEELVEFKGVLSMAPRVERSSKGERRIRFDPAGVPSTFGLNVYAAMALRPGFVSGARVGDTLIVGMEKDVYQDRIVRGKEWSAIGGKYIQVMTLAKPSAPIVTVDSFNAVKAKHQRLGWWAGPPILAYVAFTWFTKRRLDLKQEG